MEQLTIESCFSDLMKSQNYEPIATKEEGLELVEKGANDAWKTRVMQVIESVCERKDLFCSDDIEENMMLYPEQTKDRRAMGAMFKRAQKEGLCEATSTFVMSRQKSCHKCPRRLCRSLRFSR